MELIYRRTCKDKLKLIVIPLLYLMFFSVAGVFAFYSIEALIESYNHRVRTASYVTVDEYDPIGLALFPEVHHGVCECEFVCIYTCVWCACVFVCARKNKHHIPHIHTHTHCQNFATYESCQFKYGDDLSPHSGNWTPLQPVNITDNCATVINVTFRSSLVRENRTAMVFRLTHTLHPLSLPPSHPPSLPLSLSLPPSLPHPLTLSHTLTPSHTPGVQRGST